MRKQLNGEVVGDQDLWLYQFFEVPAFSPQTIRTAVEENPEGEDLVLEINSGGGSVFAGFEMYSVLRSAGCRTVAEVQSLAASAASVVMLGCQEVHASPVAQVMIHLPSMGTQGDRYDHQASIGVLDSITESILNAYTIKAGPRSSRDELKRLMRTTAWMTAPEAKGLGLVDKIVGEEEIDPAAILNSAGGVCHGIRALAAVGRPTARRAAAAVYGVGGPGKGPGQRRGKRLGKYGRPPSGEGPPGIGKNQIYRRQTMKDSTRQKYMDAMNRRADLIQQADDAFSSGEVEKGKELTTSAAALNPEIEGYQALLAQEEKFAAPRPAPLDRETRERAEDRRRR